MTTREQLKKRLKRYRAIQRERQHLQDEIERVEATLDGLKSPSWDGMPHGSGVSDPVLQAVERYNALLGRHRAQEADLAAALVEVETMIASLDSPTERDLMRLKYINGLPWEEVCVAINYSWTRTHQIHGAVLDKLLEKFGEETRNDG